MSLASKLSPQAVRSHRVLVVDDEALNLQVFDYNFGEEFTLLFAGNAEEALAILAREHVAVVIADHRMPGRLGLDLLTEISVTRPEVVRVLLTAHADVPLLVDALNRGVLFRYIAKPWTADSMRQDMHHALEQHVLQAEHLRLVHLASDQLHPPESVAAALEAELTRAREAVRAAASAIQGGDASTASFALSRAAATLDPLLADARRVATRRSPSWLPLDPGHALHAALTSVSARASAAGVEVRLVADSALPRIFGARDAVAESVAALLQNGVDAAALAPAPRWVEASASADGAGVRIRVRDSGSGFEPSAVTRTFHSGRGRAGLGLAVVRAITEGHGGELDLSRAPHAEVSVIFPAAPGRG